MKRLKINQVHIIYLFLSVSLVTFAMAGCGGSDSPASSPNYLFTERYNAPEVISYIDKYGNDFDKTQAIEAGRVYETMTWRTKGVSIKYLYDTGQVVKEEHFSTYSTVR
jgi:hypothetical protein